MIDVLNSSGFDTRPATFVAPAPENTFSPFAGGVGPPPPGGWLLPPSSWPRLHPTSPTALDAVDRLAARNLSRRVLYELQVLRDAGALLAPPRVDEEL